MEDKQYQPGIPEVARTACMVESVEMPGNATKVKGYDFNGGIDYQKLIQSYVTTGFQALHLGQAFEEINKMLKCRDLPLEPNLNVDEDLRPKSNCTIFLGYTSNMASAGIRDVIRFLVEHKLVDIVVTTAGGIEEDFIKCLAPSYLGDFKLKGETLRKQGLNRTGNLIVPNNNYGYFEKFLQPILSQMLKEQKEENVNWTPRKMIARMGKEIDNKESIYYWAYKNNIPVFSPAITDGAIGDSIYFNSYQNPGLRIDIAEDLSHLVNLSVHSKNTGMVIIGGGLAKHHICNANLMRNGADYSVYINTATEFDGSDAGAAPDEAVSWGKIKMTAKPVKVVADATLVFPLVVAETFAKYHYDKKAKKMDS